MDTAAINVNIPTELNDKLEAQAKARLTSKSAVVREALLRHVADAPQPTVNFARSARRRREEKK